VKILVTGASGFLGKRFVEKNHLHHNLVIFDKDPTSYLSKIWKSSIIVEKGLIEDNKIKTTIKKHNPDIVVHFAARSGLKICEENPLEAFKVNVLGTLNVIKGCSNTNSKLIFISSREVYGETIKNVSKEDDPLLPNNIYGITKMFGETLITQESQKNNLDYTILRLTNVYGPSRDNRGLNKIIQTAIKNNKIQINGGNQLVNIVYVDDVIDLIGLILDDKHSSKQIINVGSEETMTIKDFSNEVSKLLKKKIEFEYQPLPKFENNRFNPSLEKLRSLLGFSAKTRLKDGLKKTISQLKT